MFEDQPASDDSREGRADLQAKAQFEALGTSAQSGQKRPLCEGKRLMRGRFAQVRGVSAADSHRRDRPTRCKGVNKGGKEGVRSRCLVTGTRKNLATRLCWKPHSAVFSRKGGEREAAPAAAGGRERSLSTQATGIRRTFSAASASASPQRGQISLKHPLCLPTILPPRHKHLSLLPPASSLLRLLSHTTSPLCICLASSSLRRSRNAEARTQEAGRHSSNTAPPQTSLLGDPVDRSEN